ncbi:MAG: hypothetical protein R2941_11600 [Desulfobacterales bacterium]
MLTLFFYAVLIVPFWGWLYGAVFRQILCMVSALVKEHCGIQSCAHWIFGWWEWAIIVLFMTPNVWRMKPWSLITLPQPWKGLISFDQYVSGIYHSS